MNLSNLFWIKVLFYIYLFINIKCQNNRHIMKLSSKILKSLNLSYSEGSVYLATLELGQATLQDISRKSGVKRSTIYTFIEKLKDTGLINQTKKNKRILYSASHPEQLIELEKNRISEIEQLMPELLAIHNKSQSKPKVTFYEGQNGIKEVYQNTIKDKKPIVAWSDFDYMEKVMGKKFMEEYPKERTKKDIGLKTITRDTQTTRELAKKNIGSLRDMKFVKSGEFKTEINIYGNKTAFMSFRSEQPFAVLIEDEGIAETLRLAWKELWGKL